MVRHPYERLVSAFRDKVESCDKKVYYDSIGRCHIAISEALLFKVPQQYFHSCGTSTAVLPQQYFELCIRVMKTSLTLIPGKFAKAQYRLIPEQFSENKEELLKQSNRKVYHRTIKKDDLDLENPYETPLGTFL